MSKRTKLLLCDKSSFGRKAVMHFSQILSTYSLQIGKANEQAVRDFFDKNEPVFPLNPLIQEAVLERVNSGKMLRGGLCMALAEALGVTSIDAALTVATSLELYGYGILAQDDVSDQADTRRGLPSMQRVIAGHLHPNSVQASFTADQIAFYVGDVLYFLADYQLNLLDSFTANAGQVRASTYTELAQLGLGQIEDIRLSALPIHAAIPVEDILAMISAKSGRYSLRWPVAAAAALDGLSATHSATLSAIAEEIGVLFQIRDDELGLFGDEATLGKSVSSDVTQGKRTLYWAYAQQLTKQDDPRWQAFGNTAATPEAIARFKMMIEESGAREQVAEWVVVKKQSIETAIASLSVPQSAKKVLLGVLDFVISRQK